jgi:hypothetical protein
LENENKLLKLFKHEDKIFISLTDKLQIREDKDYNVTDNLKVNHAITCYFEKGLVYIGSKDSMKIFDS